MVNIEVHGTCSRGRHPVRSSRDYMVEIEREEDLGVEVVVVEQGFMVEEGVCFE